MEEDRIAITYIRFPLDDDAVAALADSGRHAAVRVSHRVRTRGRAAARGARASVAGLRADPARSCRRCRPARRRRSRVLTRQAACAWCGPRAAAAGPHGGRVERAARRARTSTPRLNALTDAVRRTARRRTAPTAAAA
jgi:hypothetical protein